MHKIKALIFWKITVKKKMRWNIIMHEPSTNASSLATALDGGFIRNRGKLPQSDVLEGIRVPDPVCCTACMDTLSVTFIFRRP